MKPEMGPPDAKRHEFPGPEASWRKEMIEFEKDIQLKRKPDASLAEARAAMRIVGKIYPKSGFHFDSVRARP